jgi:hypothetical protein
MFAFAVDEETGRVRRKGKAAANTPTIASVRRVRRRFRLMFFMLSVLRASSKHFSKISTTV